MPLMKKILTIGIVQMRCDRGFDKNLAHAVKSIATLAKRGADIVALPELFTGEYFCQTNNKKFFELAEKVPSGPTTEALAAAARDAKVAIVGGSIFERVDTKKSVPEFYNTALIFDERGKIVSKYRKIHIPNDLANYYGETLYFAKGDLGFPVAHLQAAPRTRGTKLAALICYDQWFPEGARAVAKKGAQIIFYPTAIGWPVKQGRVLNSAEHEAWQTMQKSHAIANNAYVVAINRVGEEHNLHFWGTSFVADPYGRILKKAGTEKEENFLVKIDLETIEQMRRDWPFLKQCL